MKKELNLSLSIKCPKCGNLITVSTENAQNGVNAECKCSHENAAAEVATSAAAAVQTASQYTVKGKAAKRLQALMAAGIDTTGMCAIGMGDGIDAIVRNNNGKVEVVADDDPIFAKIDEQGYTYNPRMFKQWVMAQLLDNAWNDDTHTIDNTQWRHWIRNVRFFDTDEVLKLFCDKQLEIAAATRNGDKTIADDVRWYNKDMYVVWMSDTYMVSLKHLLEVLLTQKNCKGQPYVRIPKAYRILGGSRNRYKGTFIADLKEKVYKPLFKMIDNVKNAETPYDVYEQLCNFRKHAIIIYRRHEYVSRWRDSSGKRVTYKHTYCQEITGKVFENAFTGYGVFFAMQNMIRFHGLSLDGRNRIDSEALLNVWASKNTTSSWWMWGAFKKALADSGFDFRAKQAEWRAIKAVKAIK